MKYACKGVQMQNYIGEQVRGRKSSNIAEIETVFGKSWLESVRKKSVTLMGKNG